MKITVVAMDTRGGIQPYVALSLGLKAAGHEVRAVAPSDLAAALRSTVTDDAMAARARALGEKVRAEDGVANAVARFGALRR
ncbi:MAG: hypothetical protein U0326_16050 [Polyangiales bacterium]